MKLNLFKKKQTKLDEEIDSVYDWLRSKSPDSPEYTKMVDNLKKLYEIKNGNGHDKIKLDTIAIGGFNLLGIWMILRYEELNIITSKALGFVLKGRV